MKLKSLAFASLMALAAFSSHADNESWGSHGALESSGLEFPTAPLFLDKYSFSLATTSQLYSFIEGVNISSATYSIFKADGTGTGFSWSYGSEGVERMATLGPGSYYYGVFGEASAGATYSLSSAAVPVPEPETYALMLAGLGVVGFVARRRKTS